MVKIDNLKSLSISYKGFLNYQFFLKNPSLKGSIDIRFGIYPSLQDKAAHLLYCVIKNHPFTDGNKRIGSFLFIVFLTKNHAIKKQNGQKIFDDSSLVSLALLIAESNPKQKDLMIKLVTNLITK